MIIDHIERFEQYSRNVPEIYDVMKFVERAKKENLPEGKYPLQNGYILIQEGTTRNFNQADFESHREYIDVQVIIAGSEYMEYAYAPGLQVKVPFDKEKDYELLSGEGCKIQITPDTFYLLYPADAHKPACHFTEPTTYKKVLAKIKIDKLIHRV